MANNNKHRNVENKCDERNKPGNNNKPANNYRNQNSNKPVKPQKPEVQASKPQHDKYSDPFMNDPDWYTKYAALLGAGKVPFTRALGLSVDMSNDAYPVKPKGSFYSVPGVCVLNLITTPGISKDNGSPVNIAAQNMYTYVRHVNSGHANYDKQDLMMYVLAMDEANMILEYAKRVYRTCFLYNVQNRYAPRYLVQAMGADYDDIIKNPVKFMSIINMFAIRLSKFCVPKGMPLFDRHEWLYQNIYTDENVDKAQVYIFNPLGFRVYDETVETGSVLKFKRYSDYATSTFGLTIDDFQKIFTEVAEALNGSEDVGIISGDILHAYGDSKLYKVTALDASTDLTPVYRPEVLNQIMNATVLPLVNVTTGGIDIKQDPAIGKGSILFTAQASIQNDGSVASTNQNPIMGNRLINCNTNEPSDAYNIVITRLTTMCDKATETAKANISSCGTEIVHSVFFALQQSATGDGSDVELVKYAYRYSNLFFDAVHTRKDYYWHMLIAVALSTKFKYSPFTCLFTNSLETDSSEAGVVNGTNVMYFQDIGNYTIMSRETLNLMHDAAIMSEFYLPESPMA